MYSEDVEMVTLPGVVGQIGVYPQHVPLMTQMVPGEIIVRKDGRDTFFATGEGLIEVTATRVAILTDLAVQADKIDEAKAEEARQRAEARLQRKTLRRRSRHPSMPRWLAPWPSCASSAGSANEAPKQISTHPARPARRALRAATADKDLSQESPVVKSGTPSSNPSKFLHSFLNENLPEA